MIAPNTYCSSLGSGEYLFSAFRSYRHSIVLSWPLGYCKLILTAMEELTDQIQRRPAY